MELTREESQDGCELLTVVQELIDVGQTHFDIFATIHGFLEVSTRRAVAGSCRSARALGNNAVKALRLSASTPPLRRDLAGVFPHAKALHLHLLKNKKGMPCNSVSAALMLQGWGTALPRLLSELTSLSLLLPLAAMMNPGIGFHSAMMDLMGRWVALASALHTVLQGQSWLLWSVCFPGQSITADPCLCCTHTIGHSSRQYGSEVILLTGLTSGCQ
jgi:hypothetical protein